MTTYTNRTNPDPLAKHRRAHTIQTQNARLVDGVPQSQILIKNYPAQRRAFGKVMSELLSARIDQMVINPKPTKSAPVRETISLDTLLKRLEEKYPQEPPQPEAGESVEVKPQREPGKVVASNIRDGFGLGTDDQKDAVRDLMRVLNVMDMGSAFWGQLLGSRQYPTVRHMLITGEFLLGVAVDANLTAFEDQQRAALLGKVREIEKLAGQLAGKLETKQEAGV